MIHKAIQRTLFLMATTVVQSTYGQTHIVTKWDSLYVELGKIQTWNHNAYNDDFKPKLPDGTWKCYDAKKKSKKLDESKLMIEGHFKDSFRHGQFIYYNTFKGRKKYKVNLHRRYEYIINYKKGLLDGYFCAYNSGLKTDEGFYKEGKKHGHFIDYYWGDPMNRIEYIRHFENDSVRDWVRYNRNGRVVDEWIGEGEYIDGQHINYDSLGNVYKIATYANGMMQKHQQFDSKGNLQEEYVGVFEKWNLQEINGWKGTYKWKFISGTFRRFVDGKLEEGKQYKDGQVIEE